MANTNFFKRMSHRVFHHHKDSQKSPSPTASIIVVDVKPIGAKPLMSHPSLNEQCPHEKVELAQTISRNWMEGEKKRIMKELRIAKNMGKADCLTMADAKRRVEAIEEWLERDLLRRVRVFQN